MLHVRAFSIAIAALLCVPDPARASCAIQLDGDIEAVAWISAELSTFAGGDTACLQLWVRCHRRADHLELELQDELGRTTRRIFASPEGAAAFLVSWSRRPLPELIGAPALAPRPGRAAGSAWHPEIELAYVRSVDSKYPNWGAVAASLLKRRSIWRYGGSLHVIAGPPRSVLNKSDYFGYVATEAAGVLAAVRQVLDRWTLRGELAVGGSVISLVTRAGAPRYQAMGLRGAVRAELGWQLRSELALVLALGNDIMRQIDYRREASPLGDRAYIHELHVDLGVRWTP
jgi:hypothetical protein